MSNFVDGSLCICWCNARFYCVNFIKVGEHEIQTKEHPNPTIKIGILLQRVFAWVGGSLNFLGLWKHLPSILEWEISVFECHNITQLLGCVHGTRDQARIIILWSWDSQFIGALMLCVVEYQHTTINAIICLQLQPFSLKINHPLVA